MRIHSPRNNAAVGRPVLLAIAVVVIVAGVLVAGALSGGHGDASADQALATVRRGPLTISVTESGTIKAREQVIIKSEVEGQTTIIYLIAEGTRVTKGELLVELDASRHEDSKVDQEIRVQNAEAAHIRSSENLAVAISQAISDIARAKLDHEFAIEDLDQYVKGEYPKQLKEAESRITLAQEDVRLAVDKRDWSTKLYAEKYISKNELERDELAKTRADLDLELAIANRDLLRDYTNKRRLAELRSDIDQAGMALERVKRKAKADRIQAEADLKAKLSEFGQQQKKLAKIEEQIAKANITAPIDGMVVYATSAKASWRGNVEPLDEGQSVRERQELIHLPTADAVMAEIKIHESSLEKVTLGMPVRVTVDALPGKVYWGEVARIAPLPDAASRWMNPDLKVYSTQIHIDGKGQGLRTGMSCQAQIIVKEFDDAVHVPIQSVVRVGAVPTVWIAKGNRIEPRPIEIGMDNNRWVHVISGLDEGQKVLLAPPLSAGDVSERVGDASAEPSSKKRPKAKPPATKQPATKQPATKQAEPKQDRRRPGRGRDGSQADRADRGRRQGRPEMSDEQRQKARRRFENMTEEERAQMRKRFESMSAEERDEAIKKMMNQ